MNLLKRLAKLFPVNAYCRWPSKKSIQIYWAFIGLVTLVLTTQSSVSLYHRSLASGLNAPLALSHTLVAAFFDVLSMSIVGAMYLLLWAVLYHIGTEILGGVQRFAAWAPGAWWRFRLMVRAIIAFVLSIPSLVGRFLHALADAFRWIVSRPAWWLSLSSRQKTSLIFTAVILTAYAAVFVAMYPVAQHVSSSLPSWASVGDMPFMQTIFIDMVLGSLTSVAGLSVLMLIVSGLVHLIKRH